MVTIVKRWDDQRCLCCGKFTIAQYDNGNYVWIPINNGFIVAAAAMSKHGAFFAALPSKKPTWEIGRASAPAAAPTAPADKCKYALPQEIAGIERERYQVLVKYNNGRYISAYSAPEDELEAAASHRVVKAALRNLRELPICNVSGEPVMVKAKHNCGFASAVFLCDHCKKGA